MAAPREKNHLTPVQQKAVAARGNILVMAGAGTGKTHTLVERCLNCLNDDRASLDEILVVTFTEAAAAEMRLRLRRALENQARENPADSRIQEQLALFDTAHIGTLHSFCFKLVRAHFYALGLDPQLSLLDEGEAYLLATETLAAQFQKHYEDTDEFSLATQDLIQTHGNDSDENIRALILRLHHYSQSRPDAQGWLADQLQMFADPEPARWRKWLETAIAEWRAEWLEALQNMGGSVPRAEEFLSLLQVESVPEMLAGIVTADKIKGWPRGTKKHRDDYKPFFDEVEFLNALVVSDGKDPLAEDWSWVRGQMQTLLRLTREFSEKFAARKLADGVLDFHDLEQFALKLLWDFTGGKPTDIARQWRDKLRFVFVDEYQDINAAQDQIITALAREGEAANRCLVGDVKQSIYRFRLANPRIFRAYAENWRGKSGQVIPLAENFRSRESLLALVNSIFRRLMRAEIGGVAYDQDAELQFGDAENRADFRIAADAAPRAELLLRIKPGGKDKQADENLALADLGDADKEARIVAARLRELKNSGHTIWDGGQKVFRPVEWRDMTILLRALSGKAEVYAKQFARAGVPLIVSRGGFYDSREILDLLSLLQLLDNPLQDVPCIAVLRSPLVGLSLDELAQIRACAGGHFWFALVQAAQSKSKIADKTRARLETFLTRFFHWRALSRQASLSQCLETVLVETHYSDWLGTQPDAALRRANLAQFLEQAQRFDQFQRQGLFRFLSFIAAQREADIEPDAIVGAAEDAVRLMSIHKSKGLEFPVVVVPDLAKRFNQQDLGTEIIFDETFGLCPKIKPPQNGRRYPSLTHWLAQRHQRRELRGEELRLLYVALTRARDTLILTGSTSMENWLRLLKTDATTQKILKANSYLDWIGLWFNSETFSSDDAQTGQTEHLRWQIVTDDKIAAMAEAVEPKEKISIRTLDAQTVDRLRKISEWRYKAEAATQRPAKSSVTALRRAATESDEEAASFFPAPRHTRAKLSAADTGTAHHEFLQHVALEKCGDIAALRSEAQRLVAENILSPAAAGALDLEAIAAFWDSTAGHDIRALPGDMVKRELPFTARFSPLELEQIAAAPAAAELANEFVVVQGVADLVVLQPGEIWLVDFKTDAARKDGLAEKIAAYAPQLKLYAAALEKIYHRPVTRRWLHFLSARRTEKI